MSWMIIKVNLFYIGVNIVLALDISRRLYCAEKYQSENCTSEIPLFVNNTYDIHDIDSPILYDEIDFCEARDTKSIPVLDEVSSQTDKLNSNYFLPLPFDIKFLKPQKCVSICTRTYTKGIKDDESKLKTIKKAILRKYRHSWFSQRGTKVTENIPVQWCTSKNGQTCYTGFPMGCYFNKKYNNSRNCNFMNVPESTGFYLFNHLNFKVTFTTGEKITSSFALDGVKGDITNIKVFPTSINHKDPNNLDCNIEEPIYLSEENTERSESLTITYSYSVYYEMDNYSKVKSTEVTLTETVADETVANKTATNQTILENCKMECTWDDFLNLFSPNSSNKLQCFHSVTIFFPTLLILVTQIFVFGNHFEF